MSKAATPPVASAKTAITPTRQQDFAAWYQEVIKAADLAEHSAVRGCMIIKPWGYAIWERVQSILDRKIKETGHQNVYFPMLIPLNFLEKEAAHVEGFAKECAVVTHYRLETNAQGQLVPSPDAQLTEPYIIRPTSETIIGNAMSKWINSYNDLPVLLNQWCNVMRWEMRTRLFLRTSEFLWQEGHTAHASADEAIAETMTMLDAYYELATDYMAMPVIKGEKTAAERFPGAVNTYTIESMMQDGKALQAGTSHFLGQNFSKAYDIDFTDKNQQMAHAWTTSWGVSTRLIGALIMTHSDDDGLVLPPMIAPEQIILLPAAMKAEDLPRVMEYCQNLAAELRKLSFNGEPLRVGIDKTDRRLGDKFWSAVKKGYPLRIEIGVREIESGNLSLTRRDLAAKDKQILDKAALLQQVSGLLSEIQTNLFERAKLFRDSHSKEITSVEELKQWFGLDENKINGFVYCAFDPTVEASVESLFKELKITARCLPFDRQNKTAKCIFSGNETQNTVILARAY